MNLCSHGHDEVCYEGHNCPACSLIEDHARTVEDKDQTIKQLENDIEEKDSEIKTLEQEVERLCRGKADGEV